MMQRLQHWTLVALATLGLLGVATAAHAVGGDPSFKMGLDRLSYTGATYTHETIATSAKETNSDVLSGADAFFEWVASEHFGLEYTTTITPLQRSYKLGAVSDNVNESTSLSLPGVNLYFTKANRKGLQYAVGVATGTASVKQEFEGGTLGKKSTTASVPVTAVKLGVEWVTNLAGVRLQYQAMTGSASNTTEVTGVKQTVNYNGSLLSLGVYTYF
ncbi:MAG TPA: hypothetical protein VF678_03785 [bacterium]